MMFKIRLCVLILTLFVAAAYSQTSTNTPTVPQPIPPSPTAASLGKYGDIPVGKYTGVPDINIPLYQITEGDIQVPISLSYHASGVKVEENASWVGLGWSLNAGGVITRSVRGKPDELGYLLSATYASSGGNALPSFMVNYATVNLAAANDCDVQTSVGYMFNAMNGVFDSEPDIYYFNFNGISGKFVLDQNGNAYTIPFQKINIQRVDNNTWILTTTDGNVYTFNQTEATTSVNLNSLNYGGPPNDGNGKSSTFVSAWYLSSIKSPSGHVVSFVYTPETSVVSSGWSQSLIYATLTNINGISNPTMNASSTQNTIQGLRLQQINFSNGNVSFVANVARTDIDATFNPNLLQKIIVSNNAGPLKQFVFNTDYFTSSDAVQSSLTRRLRLNSVTEWDGNMLSSKPPYIFTYDSSFPLPSKISTSQDHWGYYNGKNNVDANNNPTLIPTINQSSIAPVTETTFDIDYKYVTSPAPFGATVPTSVNVFSQSALNQGLKNIVYTGADRTPDFNHAKAGVLTQITYPTGGYTMFTYEPHDFDLGASNYVYATQPFNINSLSTNDNNVNNGGPNSITTVVDNGTTCINTQTFNPSSNISPSAVNLNGTISMNLTFSFNNGHPNSIGTDDIYCCGFNIPVAVLTDVTTNTVLFSITGEEGVPQTYSSSIQSQINAGTISVNGTFSYPYNPGGQTVWNNLPIFTFSGVQLDPTHTYTLSTITYHNTPGNCDSRSGCPQPSSEIITTASATGTYYIKGNQITQYNGSLGGLRIKQIADYSNASSPIIKNYSYRQTENPNISSGVILDWPVYFSSFNYNVSPQDVANVWYTAFNAYVKPSFVNYYSHQELIYYSGSKFELGQTNGSFVGYREVQENYCADNTCATLPVGKKIYRYTSPNDYPNVNSGIFGQIEVINNQGSYVGSTNNSCTSAPAPYAFTSLSSGSFSQFDNIYPYPPKTDYDYKRGLLLSEETYDGNGVLRKQITSSYNPLVDVNNYKVISGIKLGNPPNPLGPNYPTQFAWSFGRYDLIAAWNYKIQDVVTETDLNNNTLVTTTNYFYDNPMHAQLTRTELINSKGETIQEKYKYPGDEATIANSTPAELSAINELKTQFRYSTLLEKEANRNGNLISRTRTGYSDWGNGLVAPASIEMQVGNNPMETRLNYQKYDNTNGNLLQFSKTGDAPLAFQWGYNGQYPVAKVINASNNDIFYDSFEEGDGNSAYGVSKTGHYSYNGSTQTYTKTLSGLDPGSYTLSYWSLSTSGVWSLTVTPVNVTGSTYTISISGNIDDVRFYPIAAQMTTYTYDPLIGTTSITDPKSEITFYEYDKLQRLVNIKDKDGNIVKNYCYNYAGQQTGCPLTQIYTPQSTASVGANTFISPDLMDNEWKQEAPPGYTVAADNGTVINAAGNAGANAGRFAYFSTGGTVSPLTYINGTLSFTAKGSGTIEIQLIASYNSSVVARQTFTLTSDYQNFSWLLTYLYPQLEMAVGVIVNGGNSSTQASVQFQKNFTLNLTQLNLSGTYTRFRADSTSLIGNAERGWYGWNDQYNAPRKKYLQHSAYARMRFQTTARQFAIEYVRDFYDKQVVNLFDLLQTQNAVAFSSTGAIIAGNTAINSYTQVTAGQTYTISGLLTTNPTIVWFNNGAPLGAPQTMTNSGTAQAPVYQVVAPANATNLAILVQNTNDVYTVYSNCMVQHGAIGTATPSNGNIPSAFVAFTGYTPSHISGPAVFINGSLYKYYQVEGTDVAKVIQFVTDTLPAGAKTVEVMMPGQGTYLPAPPSVRRSGTYLRAVYFAGNSSATTVYPSTTAAAGSIAYIHDSILSGYNISSDAQNNVWMMMTQRNPSYSFTGDIFSEGYAGRILYTDISTPALTTAFAQKLASFGVDKFWFQIGVNDYGFLTPLPAFYAQYKSLVQQLKVLRPNAKIYIQSTGPESYEGPNAETIADDGLTDTGPAANDFRDVQRAIATSLPYCEYVNFEGLFSPVIANLSDGIHPTDAGNVLYANGIKNNSSLLGTVQSPAALAIYRSSTRPLIQSVPGIYTITATGGKAPYVFSLVSGTLPAGLTFNGDGTITGTPTAGGTASLSVKVTDANAATVTQTFSLTVTPIPTVMVSGSSTYAIVNTASSITFRGIQGSGAYTLSLTSGVVPPGMTFNATTGILSGTPTTTGTSTFTISARDHWGFTGSTTFAFQVLTTPPADNLTLTASVNSSNHLIVTGHLTTPCSQTIYAYTAAYYTPAGGTEAYLGGNNIVVAAGSTTGTAVDLGPMALVAGNFSVRLLNQGLSPSTVNGVTITTATNTTINLNTTVTSPSETLTVSATVNASGHLLITASLPNAPSNMVYTSIGATIGQNGNYVFTSGPAVNINAGALNSGPVDFGLLNVSSGAYTVQVYIGGISPNSANGYFITYSTYTNFSFTK